MPPQASGFFFAVPYSQACVLAILAPPACAGLRGSPSDNLHASLSERQTYLKILDIRLPVLALFQTKSGISLKYRRFERNPSFFDNQSVGINTVLSALSKALILQSVCVRFPSLQLVFWLLTSMLLVCKPILVACQGHGIWQLKHCFRVFLSCGLCWNTASRSVKFRLLFLTFYRADEGFPRISKYRMITLHNTNSKKH